jgi:ribonuclease I
MFSQMWIPQFCAGLVQGYDSTLTHLRRTTCSPEAWTRPPLAIHGLWPNFFTGFPACCPNAKGIIPTIDTALLSSWSFLPALERHWADPTLAPTDACAPCYGWNHEWQKHGTCFSPDDPQAYFLAGLHLLDLLNYPMAAINGMMGQTVALDAITGLFPNAVNIVCDPKDPINSNSTGALSEVCATLKRSFI